MDELGSLELLPLAEMKAKLKADQIKLNQSLAPSGEAKMVADSKDAADDSHTDDIEDRTKPLTAEAKGKCRRNEEAGKETFSNSTTSAACHFDAGQQWSTVTGRGFEPMGQAGQAFSLGLSCQPAWLTPSQI
jgi:hypothetical protein